MWIAMFLLSLVQLSSARVFKFSDEGGGSYFKLGGATSALGQRAYGNSSGSTVVFDDKQVTHGLQAEIGAVITTSILGIRIGVAGMQTAQVIATGSNASAAELFTVTSTLTVPMAVLGFEFNLMHSPDSRMYLSLSGGISQVELKNIYTFTATGASELGVTDYVEQSTAQVVVPEISLSYEHLMVDTTTMVYEFGYRMVQINELTYKSAATTINGAVAQDAVVTNNDGSTRKLDASGIFVNLAFRFYLDI